MRRANACAEKNDAACPIACQCKCKCRDLVVVMRRKHENVKVDGIALLIMSPRGD
jgi:hypothetical protein